ncbi:WhiB family redox-sensing transcriptional regulator [Catenulispora sp. GAS73]|uniref:WhiB family transcriptional regulator n=1 Tax=Catenulispora sp. GAS73 TaxID=3156269 RepID=UPI00351797B2
MLTTRPHPDLATNRDAGWQERAACRTTDQGLFFEPEHERQDVRDRRTRAAKAVCATCPVRRECLLYALSTPERYGIWGGLTAKERGRIRRQRPAGRTDRRGP